MRIAATFALVVFALVESPSLSAGEPAEDLELQLTLHTTKPVQPLEQIEYRIALVNRSKDATHRVVRPNDGSESGWREPHVFWTAGLVGADGVERPLTPHGVGRCGLFATEWWKDTTTIAAGASLDLTDQFPQPSYIFGVQEEGTLRLTAHYAWSAGRANTKGEGATKPPEDLGGMKGVGPYVLASKPVEVKLVRFLDVVAKPKAKFRVGQDVRLSDVIAVELANRTGAPFFVDPDAWDCSLDSAPPTPEIASLEPVPVDPGAKKIELFAGASTSVIGANGLAAGRDQRIRFAAAGTARLAVWISRRDGTGPRIRSNWVDVTVESAK